jgi:capsular exopolysaccharide synthesis family protein
LKRQSRRQLVVLDDPRSFSAEAYRVLRTNLHYAPAGTMLRTVLVTSAECGEGKSTTTANLGISLTQTDCSVLLVDADLRRPTLHTLLEVADSPGLSSYLSGAAAIEEVVTRTSIPNLSLIACGPIPANPADLLTSRRMRDLLQTVGGQYDMVLLDSPPVLAASDATTLAPVVDGVLLVVGSGVAPEASLRRAKDQLEAVHARILGAVVNRFDASGRDYDYSKRYYLGHVVSAGAAGPLQRPLARGRDRGREVLRRVPGAWARAIETGRTLAARGAGAAGPLQRPLARGRDRGREVLRRVPGAWARAIETGRTLAARGAGTAGLLQRPLARGRDRALRNTRVRALGRLATGAAFVVIAIGLLGRTAAPPDRVLPIAAMSSADQERAAPAAQVSAPSRVEPREIAPVETATRGTATPPEEAKPRAAPATPPTRMATGPAAAVQRPAVAPPARPTPPVEVVAIRFRVIDRTLTDWKWSWRITVHTPGDTARVNARIEFIEFRGSTRHLAGYDELCGLRLAGGPLEFIDGVHTISAANSRRVSAVSATVSAATDAAELAACRFRAAKRPLPGGPRLSGRSPASDGFGLGSAVRVGTRQ